MFDQKNPSPKILIHSPNWVGDAVMATPVPRALKRTLPSCRIHILAKAWVAPLWEGHPDVEKIITLEKTGWRPWRWWRTVRRLRQEKYDIGVILPGSFSSAWMLFWAGCRHRTGYNTDNRAGLLHTKLPWQNGVRHLPRPQAYLNLARAAGADVDLCKEWHFILRVSSEELAAAESQLQPLGEGLRIGLAPGSVAVSRRWPIQRFASLADRLAEMGYKVVVVGSLQDRDLAMALAKKAKSKPLIMAGQTTLRQAIAMIRRLDMLVSNDSGSMHLAYAQNVPVLVLQGAADPRVTGPFGSVGSIIRDEGLECSPCVRNECVREDLKCMQNISVDQVLERIGAMAAKIGDKERKHERKTIAGD